MFNYLVDSALQWGKDMIDGFIQGIKSMWDSLINTVKSVAQTVSDYLHFSVPEKGALSDFDESGGDMVVVFIKGIKSRQNALQDTMNQMASVVASTPMDIQMNRNLSAMQGNQPQGVVNYVFNQTNNSPKALSTIDIYRNTRNQFSQLKGALL